MGKEALDMAVYRLACTGLPWHGRRLFLVLEGEYCSQRGEHTLRKKSISAVMAF